MARIKRFPKREETVDHSKWGRPRESSSEDISTVIGTPILPIPIIAISGENGVGKTTFGVKCMNALIDLGYQPWLIGFADNVRHAISAIWGNVGMFDAEIDKKAIIPKIGKSARETLIAFGEGLKPYFGRDMWVRALALKIKRRLDDDHHSIKDKRILIVHDLRFKEEREWIKQHEKSLHVHITKNPNANSKSIEGLYEAPKEDLKVINDSELTDLNLYAKTVCAKLLAL